MKFFLTLIGLLFVAQAGAMTEAVLTIKGHRFEVELAVTAKERSLGLMHRRTLAPDRGMLFVYAEPQIVSFWMKQTLIPLDILFFDGEGRLLQIFDRVQPCKLTPCKTYTNEQPAQYVLELPAGSAKNIGIAVGDQFEILKQE